METIPILAYTKDAKFLTQERMRKRLRAREDLLSIMIEDYKKQNNIS